MEQYRQSIIDTLSDLVRFDTVETAPASAAAPFGQGVRDALDYTLRLLTSWGWKTCDLDGKCGWAEVGNGELFGVLCHLDTVPFGEGWTHSPTGAEIADGKLYGRGTQDDKGPFVASLYALKSLLDKGYKPTKRIRFIFGCNEETGWACMDRYLATEEIPVMAISPDGDFPVINCEKGLGHYCLRFAAPDWLLSLSAGTRVNMVPDKAEAVTSRMSDVAFTYALHHGVRVVKQDQNYRLSATGKSAHGSTPFLGDNALLKVLTAMASLNEEFNKLARGLADCNGNGCGLGLWDNQSGALTLNVGYAHKVGEDVEIGLDIRFPISYRHEDVTAALQQAFPFATVELLHAQPSLYVAPDHPLIVALLDAYQSVMGDRPAPLTIGGATYARALPCAVAFGPVFPGDPEMCHQVDEYVSLDRLQQMACIYRQAFLRLCFNDKE